MNDKIYIHELIDIIGANRARYMHHMTANWCPVGRVERNQHCFGVWATVGSTVLTMTGAKIAASTISVSNPRPKTATGLARKSLTTLWNGVCTPLESALAGVSGDTESSLCFP